MKRIRISWVKKSAKHIKQAICKPTIMTSNLKIQKRIKKTTPRKPTNPKISLRARKPKRKNNPVSIEIHKLPISSTREGSKPKVHPLNKISSLP
jgi:hypothetical protein